MKTRNGITMLALLCMVGAFTQTAQAFYDASLGMWINRDPLGELGFELVRSEQQPNFPFQTQSVNWWQGGTYFGRPKAATTELLPERPNL